jgi:hypothetical protein
MVNIYSVVCIITCKDGQVHRRLRRDISGSLGMHLRD